MALVAEAERSGNGVKLSVREVLVGGASQNSPPMRKLRRQI
jgi:hypothetical protein